MTSVCYIEMWAALLIFTKNLRELTAVDGHILCICAVLTFIYM